MTHLIPFLDRICRIWVILQHWITYLDLQDNKNNGSNVENNHDDDDDDTDGHDNHDE